MDRNSGIRKFVREVLGCTCPDKVFDRIEDRHVAPSVSPHTRCLIIGDRLLIHIWEIREKGQFKENFLAMLEAGKRERDELGLNRFRAVLAVADTGFNIADEAALYFSEFAGRDERIHLHVVPGNTLHTL